MKHLSKLLALTLSLILALGMLGAFAEGGKTYGGQDVSEHVDLVLYYVGNPIGDEEMVFAKVNEIMNEKINATIIFKALGLSDYSQKYDLLLAGREDVDLIYTSGWCYYLDEAGKGAFIEITDEMIEKYMPETFATQATASYTQGIIDGKLYYMPACKIGYGHPTALIRGDLREKYGLEPLKTPADLTAYMKAVAADKDSGVAYAYNASLDGKYLQNVYYITPNNLLTVDNSNYFYYQYVEGKTDYTADDIFFIYGSEEFKAFAQQQKELAAEGLWSRSSINNQTDVKDSFLNGTSALFINNLGTTGNVAASVMKANPEWKPEIYDLNLDKVSTAVYDADGYAVTYKSKNVERALMALDVLKNDPTAYVSIRYGIPGYHITINEDGTYSKTENYGTNHWSYGAAPSWGLKNTLLEMDEEGIFPTVPELMKTWGEISVDSPTVAFAFSTTEITDAWSALGEVYTQYIPLVQLGLVDDLDGWMEEFAIEAEAAGLDEIKAALAEQLNAYFSNL